MSKNDHSNTIDRRTFIKMSSLGAAAGLGGRALAKDAPAGGIQYRTLGRTDMKVAVVGMGAMRTAEPAVMQAAFDRGVNYIDTARCYMGGINERVVGMALKGYRDKVFVATKCHMFSPKEDIIKSCEESLRSLQTDYVDVFQLHHPAPGDMLHDDAKAALTQLRAQGKIRFTGVTAHSKEIDVLNGLADDPDKFYDMVLVTFNFKSKEDHIAAVERCAKADMGVIAMKTQQGGYKTKELGDVSPHQAALKWVLNNPNICAAVPAMVNLDEVEEDTAVLRMDLALTRRDNEILRRYDEATAGLYCHRCGLCMQGCSKGVDIPTINRSLMYVEGYGDMALARDTYAGIPEAVSAAACADCARCEAQCVNRVDIARQMRKAQVLFA